MRSMFTQHDDADHQGKETGPMWSSLETWRIQASPTWGPISFQISCRTRSELLSITIMIIMITTMHGHHRLRHHLDCGQVRVPSTSSEPVRLERRQPTFHILHKHKQWVYRNIVYWSSMYYVLTPLPPVPVAHDLEWRTSFSSSPSLNSFSSLHLHQLLALLLFAASLLSWAQGRRINSSWRKTLTNPCCTKIPATPQLSEELTRIHVVLFIFVTHSVDCNYLCIPMYYRMSFCLIRWKRSMSFSAPYFCSIYETP